MSTDLKLVINSTSSDNTERTAAKIGKNLIGGEVIELISDLGGGKTVFSKGLASGAGSSDVVSSPTFTISKIYTCPKFNIQHFDFYRLEDPGIVAYELAEVINDPKFVIVIEWAKIVNNILPKKRIRVEIEHEEGTDRIIKIHYNQATTYLIEGLIE